MMHLLERCAPQATRTTAGFVATKSHLKPAQTRCPLQRSSPEHKRRTPKMLPSHLSCFEDSIASITASPGGSSGTSTASWSLSSSAGRLTPRWRAAQTRPERPRLVDRHVVSVDRGPVAHREARCVPLCRHPDHRRTGTLPVRRNTQ